MTTPPPASSTTTTTDADEVELRTQLRKSLKSLTKREPLDLTYKPLLFDGVVTPRRPTLPPKDKLYKSITANLRETVTTYSASTQTAWDRISQRQPLEEGAMRSAFTLRENKPHEQEALAKVTLASKKISKTRKRKLEGMAMMLQKKKPKKKRDMKPAPASGGMVDAQQQEEARRRTELEKQERSRQQQQKRQQARLKREEEELRQEEETLARMRESPQQTLARYCQPLFQKLWDMEFGGILQNTNPFRIVIDANNCAAMGAPDYMDIVKKPMNLSYIHDKIKDAKYESLTEFYADVELIFTNALLYNSDPSNAYHIAAKEMRRIFHKDGKELYQKLQKHAKK